MDDRVFKEDNGRDPYTSGSDAFRVSAIIEKRSEVESQIISSCGADLPSNADAVVRPADDGPTYFVKPMEVDEPFSDFVDYVRNQEKTERRMSKDEKVKYSQAREQN